MSEFIKKFWAQASIVIIISIFFWQFLLKGLLPIPSDTIVGLYHPYLDMYAKISPAGIPFKNFLITDPVRQIIPWKNLSIESLSRFELPLWNPYEMAGKPHLANFQSSPFYPLNLILFIKPFYISWSIFIMVQPILSGIFMFAYLRNLKLGTKAGILGAIAFSFSGFSISWLEWGNIGHTALWLPLILLSIDKVVSLRSDSGQVGIQYPVFSIKRPWSLVFLLALISSFFAGHLQIFFYVFLVSFAYLLFRWFEHGKKLRTLGLFAIYYLLFAIATVVQWIPTLQFIGLSARSLDQNYFDIEGWFLPWQHLIQFLAPDFFGNPATLNYWGVWNYAEFIGYVGVVSLFLAACSILSKNKKVVLFFISAIIVSLLFATPNFIAKLPFNLSIPFLSSAQPTRLILLVAISLSILSAFGFDYLIADKKINRKAVIGIGILFAILFLALWVFAFAKVDAGIKPENLSIAKRNLIFPSGILAIGAILILGIVFVKETMARTLLIFLILALSVYDLFRAGFKFTPFTTPNYFYPETSVIKFLKKDPDVYRIAVSDSRILPPNFSTYYKLQSIEGYDPLYLLSYAELIAASERTDHSIHTPFGFNRIITPHNIDSPVIDLLNVKYVLSLSDLNSPKLVKVFQEGQTRVYENKSLLPRAFFVSRVIQSEESRDTINKIFTEDLDNTAVVADYKLQTNLSKGEVRIIDYSENDITLETGNDGDGFLVLSDSYYPSWRVKIGGANSKIYKTNHAFRGIFVPKGAHKIVFYNTLF